MSNETKAEIATAVRTAIYAEIPVVAALFAAVVLNSGTIGNVIANWIGAN